MIKSAHEPLFMTNVSPSCVEAKPRRSGFQPLTSPECGVSLPGDG